MEVHRTIPAGRWGLTTSIGAAAIVLAACSEARTDRGNEPAPAPAVAPAPTVTPTPAAAPATESAAEPAAGMREIFPHVRLDKASRVVEFDGEVPIDCHNRKTPHVYLEVTACTRNSKEHETLVVTDALPSHVHAALLLAGFVPGKPGSWRMQGDEVIRIPPEGDRLAVTIAYSDAQGREVRASATDWVVDRPTGKGLSEQGAGQWVFGGSRMVQYQGREFYDADGTGTLVGLTTFGSETVAFARVFSPDSQVDEPEWIANASRVPRYGTKVVVRIGPAN